MNFTIPANLKSKYMGMGVLIHPKLEQNGFSCHHLKDKLPEKWITLEHMAFWGSLKDLKDPAQSGIGLEEFVRVVNRQIKIFKNRRHRQKCKGRTANSAFRKGKNVSGKGGY
ncbi:MAG: hypothetical protein ACTSRS_21135 [Candidatus Helarchaeota archaeon]